MSVLIKGMDIPEKGCYKCWAREGNWCSLLKDVPYHEIIFCAHEEKRHEDCPMEDGTPYEMQMIIEKERQADGGVCCL